ncbi:MAG: T9SS type A sorting domain-containing protein [Flavobacteriales bacterium]|nr:T9SS type A sorting domain-containing protein [Flavobacteriales bacterium]
MAPLLEPMVVGQTYYCSFRANAAFGGNAQYPQIWLANDKVGLLFTTYERHWYQGDPYPAPLNDAHVIYSQVLTDTVGWTLVSGSFMADSAYQYLMIGNFFSNALTDTLHFANPNSVFPWYPRGYTLIDAVCVSPNPMGCDLGQSVGEELAVGPVLFPNPAHDLLVVGGRSGARLVAMDAVGRVIWQGVVGSDRWVLPVGAWARGTYVLRLEWNGRTEVHKFVLAE